LPLRDWRQSAHYEDEKLIERSRHLGGANVARIKRLQQKHRVIGDVRGGHGLFAIALELVSDQISRTRWQPGRKRLRN